MSRTTKQVLWRDLTRFLSWLLVLLPFDRAACRVRRPLRAESAKVKVLILRPDALGDLVLWLDAAEALRALYPPDEYEITLLVNQNWQPLAETLPWFDAVWGMDRRRFATRPLYRYGYLKKVRQAGFDVVLNTVFVRDFLWSDPVVRVSGAPVRVGYHGDFSIITPALMTFADRWYTRIVRSRAGEVTELERNADFVRALGAGGYRAGVSRLPLTAPLPAGFPSGAYFLLVPGAGKDYRQWPAAGFAEIARRLCRERGWTGVVVGTAADAALGAQIIAAAGAEAPVENWAGRTTLAEIARVAAGAALVVSNETSTVHVAAAVGTPAVSVTGGGHFGRYVPYRPETPVRQPLPVTASHPMPCFGCNWQCIYPVPPGTPTPCIARITVEAVWSAVQEALSRNGEENGEESRL